MTELYHKGKITIDRIAELMSVNPAKLLHVEGGILKEGAAADVTVIDPERNGRCTGKICIPNRCSRRLRA